MKMAAARNTSAGAVFPVPAGTSQRHRRDGDAHHYLHHAAPAAGRRRGLRGRWLLRGGQAGKHAVPGGGQGGHWATSLTSRSSRSRCRAAKSGWSAVAATSASPASSTSRHSCRVRPGGPARCGQRSRTSVAEPALPGDRVPDPGTPAVRRAARDGQQPGGRGGYAGPDTARSSARTGRRRAAARRHISPAAQSTTPVTVLAGQQQIAGPEIAMHHGARGAGGRQARSQRAKLAGQRGGAAVRRASARRSARPPRRAARSARPRPRCRHAGRRASSPAAVKSARTAAGRARWRKAW